MLLSAGFSLNGLTSAKIRIITIKDIADREMIRAYGLASSVVDIAVGTGVLVAVVVPSHSGRSEQSWVGLVLHILDNSQQMVECPYLGT